jgi:fatty-acyl-CoA synthase
MLRTQDRSVPTATAHWPAGTSEPVRETTVGGVLRDAAADTPGRPGYLRIEGRLTDMIIRGGENIYPREIEELLFAHPGVAEIAVVGIPDPRWREIVVAVVRPPGTAPAADELERYCQEHLAAYKCPQRWLFVDAFPLTASGKIQKFTLRESLSIG